MTYQPKIMQLYQNHTRVSYINVVQKKTWMCRFLVLFFRSGALYFGQIFAQKRRFRRKDILKNY